VQRSPACLIGEALRHSPVVKSAPAVCPR
jgi:hypothetical protein